MSYVTMPAPIVRLIMCASLALALGTAHTSDWHRTSQGVMVASGPKLPIKNSFSGYIIAVG
jgi:hypothetical protein